MDFEGGGPEAQPFHNLSNLDGEPAEGSEHKRRGLGSMEEQVFKKQMEFKSGKLHQVITDQVTNTNEIFANRYQGTLGLWYFFIDTVLHFENFLSLLLFLLIWFNQSEMISISFPLMALSVNVLLMMVRNIAFEMRQRTVTRKINDKIVSALYIS